MKKIHSLILILIAFLIFIPNVNAATAEVPNNSQQETITCSYSQEIKGCLKCEITLEFWLNDKSYRVGESVVKSSKIVKGAISKINLITDEWNKKTYDSFYDKTNAPFYEYLSNGKCPEGLYFDYNKELDVYVDKTSYDKYQEGKRFSSGGFSGICNETGVLKGLKFLGYILYVVKVAVPLILIIMGSIDFGKAVIASNQDAVQKAATTFVTRIVAGVLIFLLPTVVNFVFSLIPSSINDYSRCRTCLFSPNECNTSGTKK